MAVEIVNWIEIPVLDMERARRFYEAIFEFKIVDLKVGDDSYSCFPNKTGEGFSGALVQYDFTKPGKNGPLVYLNPYTDIDTVLQRIKAAGGKVIKERKEVAPGFGYFAMFEDTEGNMLALQGER
jgi:uncharacterized protein